MQSEERFGLNADPDGDGFTNELTVADLTSVSLFQATLAVPGRVIPNDPAVEHANRRGETVFNQIGCASCHATLPLTSENNPGLPGQPGWIYFEPNPYNPAAGPNSPNLQLGNPKYPVTHRGSAERAVAAAAATCARWRGHGARLHRPEAT